MKILWISNIPFGALCELGGQRKSTGGSWLDATFDALSNVNGIELSVVTVSRVKEIRIKKEGNHTFYILPGGYPIEYDHQSLKNRKHWEQIHQECSPDLIQVWGTEYSHGYLALKVMNRIPAVIYMQGVMSQIERHYLSGISNINLIKSISFRDILKWDWIIQQQKKFYKSSLIEAKMLQIAGNVIVENQWCAMHCTSIAPCEIHISKLYIKEEYYNHNWSLEKMRPFTIMCNAAGYPIKGLHILLKALVLVKKKYPEVKLLIPGESSPYDSTFFERLKLSGYAKYIIKLIEINDLKENIVFLGKLTADEMAKEMEKANVFVMPSSIENHSSTLIEAIIVGVPCVSSYVGGVPEYLFHNINGLLYRFEEHEILSSHILKIFQEPSFASQMALTAKNEMRISRKASSLKEELLEIYKKILNV